MPGQQATASELMTTRSADDTRYLGAALGRLMSGGEIVLMTGPFGSGKTVFAQGIADGMGITDQITSPSFTLANSYESTTDRPGIHHLDLYRVSNIEEALAFGLEEYFEDTDVTLIEWPGEVSTLLGEEAIRLEIAIVEANTRSLTISFPDRPNSMADHFRSSTKHRA